MVIEAAALGDMRLVWFMLLFASAGVFHHAGIKVPFFAFLSHDSGIRCKEAPWHMLLAMGLAAALCIGIGVFPQALYSLLPYATEYRPYEAGHVISQGQLLFFSALAFTLLLLAGVYPAEIRAINLDVDILTRKGGRAFYGPCGPRPERPERLGRRGRYPSPDAPAGPVLPDAFAASINRWMQARCGLHF